MTETVSPSRRHLLSAGAWAVPAVVLSSAAPSYATSGAAAPTLFVAPVAAGREVGVAATVTFSTAALPVAAGSVTLALERLSGTGNYIGGGASGSWASGWDPNHVLRPIWTVQSDVQEVTSFFFVLTAPSAWRLTLTSPTGTDSRDFSIVAAAPGARVEPVPQGRT